MANEPASTGAPPSIGAQSTTPARALPLEAALRWSLALLLAALPFELNTGIPIAGLTFTNVELLAMGVLGLWLAALAADRRLPQVPRGLAIPAALFLAILFASALAAPAWRGAALKFTARQAQGALLAACLADQLARNGWPLAGRLACALLAGGLCSALLGLLELSEAPAALALLAPFKEQPTMMGGLLRLSATFSYANIAAMYYEALLPLLLAAAGLATGRRAWWLCASGACLLYSAALLTYSRASLIAATLVVIGVALAAIWASAQLDSAARQPAGRRLAWLVARPIRQTASICAGLLAIAISMLLLSQAFRVRIVEPDVDRWYRAEYRGAALPPLLPGALIQAPVTVRNSGLVTWYPDGLRPTALSYHWLDAQTRLVVRYNGDRTILPRPVEPGEAIALDAYVRAPSRPGAYILAWDMLAEHSGWFSSRGSSITESLVTVAGPPAPEQAAPPPDPPGLPQRIAAAPAPPDRRQLWAVALRFWRARPLLGIGPDVFRHIYGPELGLSRWDDRVHTNNLYLELLAGAGIAGLLAFLALVGAALLEGIRLLARPAGTHGGAPPWRWWAALGCTGGLATYLIHGTLDMFLEYSATYLLLWALIGSLAGLAAIERDGDARTG